MDLMADLRELADIAVELARAAGELLRKRPDDLGVQSKSTPTDAVTDMDRAAERLVLDGLRERRPGDRVVAEESGDSSADSEVVWYVDPLDGTVNYLYGLPPYAVSIAAFVNGEPAAGAVYDVSRDEMFTATAGGGAPATVSLGVPRAVRSCAGVGGDRVWLRRVFSGRAG